MSLNPHEKTRTQICTEERWLILWQGEDSHLHAKKKGLEQILSSRPWEGSTLLTPSSQDSQSPELLKNKFLLFKPPSLWYLVKTGLAN